MTAEGITAPLPVESGGKTLKRVAVANPLSRGGHTQVAVFGAFSKNGGRRGGCVLFGHKASLTRQQQLQRLIARVDGECVVRLSWV